MIPALLLRPTVLLSVALAISALGNVFFLYHTGKAAGEHRADAKLAAATQRAEKAEQAEAVSKALMDMGIEDHAHLLNELAAISERGQQTRVVYRAAAAKAPLPVNCAPGQERVNAVNATLGAAK